MPWVPNPGDRPEREPEPPRGAKRAEDMNRGELVAEVRRLRDIVATHMRTDDLRVESGVNAQGKPFVRQMWGDQTGQLTPDEARAHALKLLEVAFAAEFDAALFAGVVAVGGGPDEAMSMLLMVREHRPGASDRTSGGG